MLIDPYASSFLKDRNAKSQWATDVTDMKLGVHERKFEIDSLAAVLKL